MLWIGFRDGSGLPSKLAGERPRFGWGENDFVTEPERLVGKGGRWLVSVFDFSKWAQRVKVHLNLRDDFQMKLVDESRNGVEV